MRIKVNRDNCTGCRLCMQICAIEHYNEINPKKAAMKVDAQFPNPGKYKPVVCTQCGKCYEACTYGAISQAKNGAYIVDKEKCTNCGDCVSACPFGVVFQHRELDHVIICDFCMKCTQLCNTAAIVPWEPKKKAAKVKEA
jgi:anaerobic carbon-monoxide dehydrogenase iron sulfur subunit